MYLDFYFIIKIRKKINEELNELFKNWKKIINHIVEWEKIENKTLDRGYFSTDLTIARQSYICMFII